MMMVHTATSPFVGILGLAVAVWVPLQVGRQPLTWIVLIADVSVPMIVAIDQSIDQAVAGVGGNII